MQNINIIDRLIKNKYSVKNIYMVDKNRTDRKNVFQTYSSKTMQEEGVYVCYNCGQKIYLETKSILPTCPKCGYNLFTKNKK